MYVKMAPDGDDSNSCVETSPCASFEGIFNKKNSLITIKVLGSTFMNKQIDVNNNFLNITGEQSSTTLSHSDLVSSVVAHFVLVSVGCVSFVNITLIHSDSGSLMSLNDVGEIKIIDCFLKGIVNKEYANSLILAQKGIVFIKNTQIYMLNLVESLIVLVSNVVITVIDSEIFNVNASYCPLFLKCVSDSDIDSTTMNLLNLRFENLSVDSNKGGIFNIDISHQASFFIFSCSFVNVSVFSSTNGIYSFFLFADVFC
jgi:hypothetical protein